MPRPRQRGEPTVQFWVRVRRGLESAPMSDGAFVGDVSVTAGGGVVRGADVGGAAAFGNDGDPAGSGVVNSGDAGEPAAVGGSAAGGVSLSDSIRFIDTVAGLHAAVAEIRALATGALAIDLEGVDLGRYGEICIVQIALARSGAPIYLFDICALGASAFDDTGAASLRSLCEDDALEKLFFDVRSDANALFFHFGVRVSRVVDIQLLDVAHRLLTGLPCRGVSGLGYIVEKTPHARLSVADRERLTAIKEESRDLFVPERGGSYEVWKARPLPDLLREYCTDATLFFSLRESFLEGSIAELGDDGDAALAAAAQRRLDFAHSEEFDKSNRDVLCSIDEELRADLSELNGGLPSPFGGGWHGRGRGRGGRGRGRGRGRGQ